MSSKRIVSIEVDSETFVDMDGIQRGLGRLCRLSEDSIHFENLLSRAVEYLYTTLPNGQTNYGEDDSQIGHIWLGRFNNKQGNVNIEFNPSNKFKKENGVHFTQTSIGYINLRDNIYSISGGGITKTLREDTEKVMEILKLKKKN